LKIRSIVFGFIVFSFYLLSFEIVFSDIESTEVETRLDNNLTKNSSPSKVHPLIVEWQKSSNPKEFAEKNNLSYSDGMIVVYLYVDSEKSIGKLPSDIEIISSYEDILVAKVSSNQINELDQIDVVKRIAPPIYPRMLSTSNEPGINDQYLVIVGIVIAAILVIIFIIFLRSKNILKKV